MSTWRRKAIECLPDYKKEFEDPNTSTYTVLSEILCATIKAHRETDEIKLKQFYGFAEWCFKQKDQNLWNAAGVSFYEHLGDNKETFLAMPKWISKEIYFQIRGLLELRISSEKIKVLDQIYNA